MLTPETMLIVAGAAFLLFGGKKLPELGRSLGHGIREFKAGTQGLKNELEAQMAAPEVSPPSASQQPVVSSAHASVTPPTILPPIILPSDPVRTVTLLTSQPASPPRAEDH